MKTILASIDFSLISREVLAKTVALARLLKARIVVLHAVQPPIIVTDIAPLAGDSFLVTAQAEKSALKYLDRLKKRLGKTGLKVDTICEQGHPISLILSHAERLSASYIVLGSHGHTALYDLVVGGTTSGVLKRATCPVLVVPARPKSAKRKPAKKKAASKI